MRENNVRRSARNFWFSLLALGTSLHLRYRLAPRSDRSVLDRAIIALVSRLCFDPYPTSERRRRQDRLRTGGIWGVVLLVPLASLVSWNLLSPATTLPAPNAASQPPLIGAGGGSDGENVIQPPVRSTPRPPTLPVVMGPIVRNPRTFRLVKAQPTTGSPAGTTHRHVTTPTTTTATTGKPAATTPTSKPTPSAHPSTAPSEQPGGYPQPGPSTTTPTDEPSPSTDPDPSSDPGGDPEASSDPDPETKVDDGDVVPSAPEPEVTDTSSSDVNTP
jgi:hypothetical protein